MSVAIVVDTNTDPQFVPTTSNVTVISSNIDDLSAESLHLVQDGTVSVEIDRNWVVGMDEPMGESSGVSQIWYIS